MVVVVVRARAMVVAMVTAMAMVSRQAREPFPGALPPPIRLHALPRRFCLARQATPIRFDACAY